MYVEGLLEFYFILFVLFFKATFANYDSVTVVVTSLNNGEGDDSESRMVLDYTKSCPINTICQPLSTCTIFKDLFDETCLKSDSYFHRINELICGRDSQEPSVCCPVSECTGRPDDGLYMCGQSMVRGTRNHDLGGQPWVARIGFTQVKTGHVRYVCTGSILSQVTVLTTAHCARAQNGGYKLSSVLVGEWNVSSSEDCSQYFCAPPVQILVIDYTIIHPGYDGSIFRHDIAIIVLEDKIRFNVAVAPICLNNEPEVERRTALLVGWGRLSGQQKVVLHQQVIDVRLENIITCERFYLNKVPLTDAQICGVALMGRDACSGFGGAPLVVEERGRFLQIGIVSFGSEACEAGDVPSVYTNVGYYYKWIIENKPI